MGKSIIVGGSNYGQGSSREHAALAPLYLGVKAVIAKSFARIHAANLVNSGILPMSFDNEADYDTIDLSDEFLIENAKAQLMGGDVIVVKNVTKSLEYKMNIALSPRQKDMLLAGGLINYTRECAK